MRCCKCLCDYEFDVLGLYINFEDKTLDDVRYLLDKWCLVNKVDLRQLDIAFNYFNYDFLQRYGQHNKLDNYKWLLSLGLYQYNFFTDKLVNHIEDYINMYNYVISHRSIAMFIGEMTSDMKLEYNNYIKCLKVPVIHLTQDNYVRTFWTGISDKEYNYYLDNLS